MIEKFFKWVAKNNAEYYQSQGYHYSGAGYQPAERFLDSNDSPLGSAGVPILKERSEVVITKRYDRGSKEGQIYKGKCQCGRELEVETQDDSCPEFYTPVYVRCICGEQVKFILPSG